MFANLLFRIQTIYNSTYSKQYVFETINTNDFTNSNGIYLSIRCFKES